MEKSITQSSARNSWGCLLGFGLLFALAGAAFSVVMVVPAVSDMLRSRLWQATPCIMLSSEVETVHGDDGDTYRVAVKYRYEFSGKEYVGDRYRLIKSSSGGRKGKQDTVNRLRPGTKATCYVNPANPAKSVMDRSIGWDALLLFLPVLFMAVGLGIMYLALRQRRNALAPSAPGESPGRQYETPVRHSMFSRATSPAAMHDQPLELSAAGSRGKKVLLLLLFALFWNGIVSVFVYGIFFSGSRIETCGAIFIIPFVAVGLGLLGAVVHSLLAIGNPRPTIRLARQHLCPGDSAELRWSFSGNVHKISRLRLYVELREAATYRRGTSTSTDHAVLLTIPLADVSSTREITAGRAELRIPQQCMPSFRCANNAIEWRLIVHGEIENWPDVKDEFPLTIYPLGEEGVRRGTAD